MELLAPAGSFEKLELAFSYGADAVYLAGEKFGLRERSDNFTIAELKRAHDLAKRSGKKIYLVLNGHLADNDFKLLVEFLSEIKRSQIEIDAAICADLGVISTVKKETSWKIHLSTQASCLNAASAKWWQQVGVDRIILGREVSLQDAAEIKLTTGLEIELFVHGSWCMSFSGHCSISNFTEGRDANRGGCAHSCRFEYELTYENGETLTETFLSSPDLMGLKQLTHYKKAGVDSLKIEGRMKGPLYLATVCKTYRQAISALSSGTFHDWIHQLENELYQFSHRTYSDSHLIGLGWDRAHSNRKESSAPRLMAQVLQYHSSPKGDNKVLIHTKNKLLSGEKLTLLSMDARGNIPFTIDQLCNFSGEIIEIAGPTQAVWLPWKWQYEPKPGEVIREGW